jgi:hypothetical protein
MLEVITNRQYLAVYDKGFERTIPPAACTSSSPVELARSLSRARRRSVRYPLTVVADLPGAPADYAPAVCGLGRMLAKFQVGLEVKNRWGLQPTGILKVGPVEQVSSIDLPLPSVKYLRHQAVSKNRGGPLVSLCHNRG